MPTLHREYPPKLGALVANARRFHEVAWHAGPEKGASNTVRMHTFSGFLTTLFEHHDSTVLLLETGKNDASGFALARVLVETFYRGLWVYLCASDEQVIEIRNGGEPYPRFIDMTQEVDRRLGGTRKLELGRPIWSALNGFTHTGLEQLSRRFNSEGDLVPDYSLEEVLLVLSSGTMLVSTMSQFFCVVSKRKADADLISNSWHPSSMRKPENILINRSRVPRVSLSRSKKSLMQTTLICIHRNKDRGSVSAPPFGRDSRIDLRHAFFDRHIRIGVRNLPSQRIEPLAHPRKLLRIYIGRNRAAIFIHRAIR